MTSEEKRVHNRLWRAHKRKTDPEFREKDRARSRVYYHSRKGSAEFKLRRRAKKFNLTEAQLDTIRRHTECEICGRKPNKRALCIDHDHTTGEFRGMLCNSCNTALGHLGDSVEAAQRLIRYLTERSNLLFRTTVPVTLTELI